MSSSREVIREAQQLLADLGYDPGPIDGVAGRKTRDAVIAFQTAAGLQVDGIIGPVTLSALRERRGRPIWPTRDNLVAFFGQPGTNRCTAGSVKLPVPFVLSWAPNTKINKFACHEIVAPYIQRIFFDACAHYGEERFNELRLNVFSGCYSFRNTRAGSSISTHAWGIAVDIDAENNQLSWGRDKAQLARPEYDAFWRIVESTGAVSLGRARNYDWMHFQFCRLSER